MADTPLAQLLGLKDLFRRTGAVHEFQRANLLLWAELTAPHWDVSQVQVKPEAFEVAFDYERPASVVYRLLHREPSNFEERLTGLREAVQVMFGDDYSVVVKLGGKVEYVGDRSSSMAVVPKFDGVDFEAGRIVPAKVWKFGAA